ncbi:hypothetical protein B0H12DRAFT_1070255 [Mycena haematopus]|nr:hypothetical protein B0H12DRAFT_1070255 [Mycena haematopus]
MPACRDIVILAAGLNGASSSSSIPCGECTLGEVPTATRATATGERDHDVITASSCGSFWLDAWMSRTWQLRWQQGRRTNGVPSAPGHASVWTIAQVENPAEKSTFSLQYYFPAAAAIDQIDQTSLGTPQSESRIVTTVMGRFGTFGVFTSPFFEFTAWKGARSVMFSISQITRL